MSSRRRPLCLSTTYYLRLCPALGISSVTSTGCGPHEMTDVTGCYDTSHLFHAYSWGAYPIPSRIQYTPWVGME